MQVAIRAARNPIYTLTVTGSQKGMNLLQLISAHEGIPLTYLKVLHEGRALNPHTSSPAKVSSLGQASQSRLKYKVGAAQLSYRLHNPNIVYLDILSLTTNQGEATINV